MKRFQKTFDFIGVLRAVVLGLFFIAVVFMALTGCGTPKAIECSKPAIQMANMSHLYQHCKDKQWQDQ